VGLPWPLCLALGLGDPETWHLAFARRWFLGALRHLALGPGFYPTKCRSSLPKAGRRLPSASPLSLTAFPGPSPASATFLLCFALELATFPLCFVQEPELGLVPVSQGLWPETETFSPTK
jgi:hypothetical protein